MGVDSRTGEALVGYRKNAGFDLTLSAPKSVSLLWGLGDRATAGEVVAAHDRAVLAVLAYLEDSASTVRRGKGGSVHHHAGGLVVAAFRHRTSREADPQLHTHLVTANMALGPDGRWTALHSTDIRHHSRTAGFIYQSVLRHEVAEQLSVAFESDSSATTSSLRRAAASRHASTWTLSEAEPSRGIDCWA